MQTLTESEVTLKLCHSIPQVNINWNANLDRHTAQVYLPGPRASSQGTRYCYWAVRHTQADGNTA
jgi:hypothetical protein